MPTRAIVVQTLGWENAWKAVVRYEAAGLIDFGILVEQSELFDVTVGYEPGLPAPADDYVIAPHISVPTRFAPFPMAGFAFTWDGFRFVPRSPDERWARHATLDPAWWAERYPGGLPWE